MSSAIGRVIIYTGHAISGFIKGPYEVSIRESVNLFQHFSKRHRQLEIKSNNAEELAGSLSEQCLQKTLVVLPAGPASIYDEMPQEISALLKDKLEKGEISLFTTCGSTYAVAKKRFWDSAIQRETTSMIGLIDAEARGPLHPDRDQPFGSDFVSFTSTITYGDREFKIYNGGGGSLFSQEEKQKRVLGGYKADELKSLEKDKAWEKAVVAYRVGLGTLAASMVHLEISGDTVQDFEESLNSAFPTRKDNWEAIREEISCLPDRLFLLEKIIEACETPL